MVRHEFLVLAFAGSNPAAPAINLKSKYYKWVVKHIKPRISRGLISSLQFCQPYKNKLYLYKLRMLGKLFLIILNQFFEYQKKDMSKKH